MTRRALVTGAGGVIAGGVTERLLADGYDVLAVDSRASALEDLARLGAEVEQLELPSTRMERLVSLARPEVVVHAAAIVHHDLLQAEPALGFRVNARAAVELLDSAASAGVARFVFLSSRAVYGLAEGGMSSDPPVAEDEPLDPQGVYDVCKVAVEGMGRNYAATGAMSFVALRFATIFGPGKSERHSNASLFSRLIEEPFEGRAVHVDGSPDESYDLVYVDDVRDAVHRAATIPSVLASAYNVGSGRITTLRDVIEAVQGQIPGASITISGAGQALPLRYRYPLDISAARDSLGYRPAISVEDAVQRYVEELRRSRSKAT